jgi:hypothetical protein
MNLNNNHWITGFTDGEGCFSFSIIKNEKMTNKVQIQGEFTVTQHKRNIAVLYSLKKFFKCGSVTVNHGNIYHFRVKNNKHLLNIIVPFFEK